MVRIGNVTLNPSGICLRLSDGFQQKKKLLHEILPQQSFIISNYKSHLNLVLCKTDCNTFFKVVFIFSLTYKRNIILRCKHCNCVAARIGHVSLFNLDIVVYSGWEYRNIGFGGIHQFSAATISGRHHQQKHDTKTKS